MIVVDLVLCFDVLDITYKQALIDCFYTERDTLVFH